MEQIPKYFEERPALLCYGKDFAQYVYDATIERYFNAYDGKGNPKFVNKLAPYTKAFTAEQMNALKSITKYIIFDSIIQVIDRFELNPHFKLVVEQDGNNVDISEFDPESNELLFDMLGEEGLINLLSKYGAMIDL